MIAPSRPLHEIQLHHALGGGAADVAALTEYGEAARVDSFRFAVALSPDRGTRRL